MENKRNRDIWMILISALCALGFFYMDVFVLPLAPRSDTDLARTTVMVLLVFAALMATYRLPRWRYILYVTLALSAIILILPTYLWLFDSESAHTVLTRRLLAIGALWFLAAGAIQNRRAVQVIEQMNVDLEARVADRAAQYEHANEASRHSEARLNEAQRIAGIGSWEWDIEKDEIWRSEELYRLLGVDRDDFAGGYEAFLEHVHPDDRNKVRNDVQRALDGHGTHSVEHRLVHSDGAVRIVHRQGIVFFDENGRPKRMAGTTQDITERKRMQRRIEELLVRLEALTNVAFDGIVISEKGIVTEGTDHFAQKLGYDPEEVRGNPVTDYVAPASRPLVMKQIAKKQSAPFEIRLLRKDGSSFPAEAVGADITVDGRTLRVSGFRDISARAELEREVVAIGERERRRIGRDLHDGVGQLLFGASLTLQGVCQQLMKEHSPLYDNVKKAQHIVENSIDETRRVSHLLVPTAYGSGEELGNALRDLVAKINEHSIVNCTAECCYEGSTSSEEVAMHLYRIAQESVNNALKHSEAENIELKFYQDGGLLRLEILDDGIGISNEQMDQPTGLGVRSLHYRAHMISGTLEISRRESGGTRVLCTCPV